MDTRKRYRPRERRESLLDTYQRLIEKHGFGAVNCAQVANAEGVATSLIFHYFQSAEGFKRELFRRALRQHNVDLVATGLANGHLNKSELSPGLRKAVAKRLVG